MSIIVKKIDNAMVASYLGVAHNEDVLFLTGTDFAGMLAQERERAAHPPTPKLASTPKVAATRSAAGPISETADPTSTNGRFSQMTQLSLAERRILNFLDYSKRALSRSEVLTKAGLSEMAWSVAIKSLRDQNYVRVIGQRRSAKYVLTDATEANATSVNTTLVSTTNIANITSESAIADEVEDAVARAEAVMEELESETEPKALQPETEEEELFDDSGAEFDPEDSDYVAEDDEDDEDEEDEDEDGDVDGDSDEEEKVAPSIFADKNSNGNPTTNW